MLDVLKAIKTATDDNTDVLNIVAQSVDIMLEQFPNMHEEVKTLLIQILDKIPAACNCNIDEVIAKLEIIITKITDDKSNSNEGIIDDLDELENLLQ